MATSNLQQWNNPATNQLSDADYAANSQRAGGSVDDSPFPAELANKLFYQVTTFVAAFGGMMALKGYNISDADINVLQATLANLLTTNDQSPTLQVVGYSPTPVFNAAASSGYQMQLAGNVTGMKISNVRPGQFFALYLVQDGVGERTVSWPANVAGAAQPDPTAGILTLFLFRADSNGVLQSVGPATSTNGLFSKAQVIAGSTRTDSLTTNNLTTNNLTAAVAAIVSATINTLVAGTFRADTLTLTAPGGNGQVLTNVGGFFIPQDPAVAQGSVTNRLGAYSPGNVYQNTSGAAIFVSGSLNTNGSGTGEVTVTIGPNGGALNLVAWKNAATATVNGFDAGFAATVPNGWVYRVDASDHVSTVVHSWIETKLA